MIAFSGIAFTSGQRLPFERIAELARSRQILTLMDAAQCAGAVALGLADTAIDFCALPLQKWLCGPEGLGALYVRDDSHAELRRDRVAQSLGVLEATIEHLAWLRKSLGWDWIFDRTAELAAHARNIFAKQPGVRILTPERHGGLITIESAPAAAKLIARRLNRKKVDVRHWPELDRYRISTAFFNTEQEIRTAAKLFAEPVGQRRTNHAS